MEHNEESNEQVKSEEGNTLPQTQVATDDGTKSSSQVESGDKPKHWWGPGEHDTY